MGCIIAATGTKTLCNKKAILKDVIDYFNSNVTCPDCLIRQDAMFERGYTQKEYVIWYTIDGSWLSYERELYNKYGVMHLSIPRKCHRIILPMWDNKTVRGAIKLAKIGAHNMGASK